MASVKSFFDPATFSFTHVLSDPATNRAAIIDPVCDFDQSAGRLSRTTADQLLDYVAAAGLQVDWVLETHVHADHLSAGRYLCRRLGAQLAIGCEVVRVQRHFARTFNAGAGFCANGSQFDRLLAEGDELSVGELTLSVMHTPGHTPACVTYVVEDMAFVGDTLFMPDYGTARCDFPDGDARTLYRSIQRLLALPDSTRLYLCHDYGTETRKEFCGVTTVADQRQHNLHLARDEDEFVRFRQCRDATLNAPRLLYPAVQYNMRGGALPAPECNGQHYFKIPLSVTGG